MRRVRLTHWRGRTNTASGSWRPRASRSRVAVRAAAFVVAIVPTLALSAPNALAATKSSREFVPGGAHVLIWSTTSVADGGTNATIVVTNLEVIAQVRALINALPLTSTLHHACPDDMMLPITLSFAASRASTPFTRVIFQLGGCPSAEVVQHGSIVLPTLGGPNLSSTYRKIKKLIG